MYLNPSLSASSKLFNELNRDTPLLERFIVASSKLVTDVADRREDVSGLVDNLATTTTAIGSEQEALADAIGQLPPFMRRANTTFLNLRATLDDLDPLVEDSKPVAKKLRPFMAELRPLARDARPTFRDLADILRRPGADNDALELTRLQVPLRNATVREVEANGKKRQAAFPAITDAVREYAPIVASVRPYAPDALGWFDDFSHSGIYDALGAASRVGIHASAFTLANGQLSPVPPELRGAGVRVGRGAQPAQPLPGLRRARERGRLQSVEAGRGGLRPEPGAPGQVDARDPHDHPRARRRRRRRLPGGGPRRRPRQAAVHGRASTTRSAWSRAPT